MSDLPEALSQYSLRGGRVASQAASDGIGSDLVRIVKAARRWDAFPSDEDVEAAAVGMVGGEKWWPLNDPEARTSALHKARAALEAVKARET